MEGKRRTIAIKGGYEMETLLFFTEICSSRSLTII
jgi:hypothetical protein